MITISVMHAYQVQNSFNCFGDCRVDLVEDNGERMFSDVVHESGNKRYRSFCYEGTFEWIVFAAVVCSWTVCLTVSGHRQK